MLSYVTIYFDDQPRAGRAIDVWIPSQKPVRDHVLFFVHGGGWRNGRRDDMHAIMHGFYQEGYICVSVDYRLAPENVPAQLSDVREGMTLADNYLKGKGLSRPFVIYGSSAGGHLALLAGLAAPGACGDSFQGAAIPVKGIVASCAPLRFEPWEDIFPGSWSAIQEAVGASYERHPEKYRVLSPEIYAHIDSPRLFFLLGECEHMFPNAQAIALVERLREQGGMAEYRIYPAAEHGFFYALTRNSQRAAFRDILSFLEGVPK